MLVNVSRFFPCDILTKLQIWFQSDLEKANPVQPLLTDSLASMINMGTGSCIE